MSPSQISISNACAKNLRIASLSFTQGMLHALTGPSGSGKSALLSNTLALQSAKRQQFLLGSFFHRPIDSQVQVFGTGQQMDSAQTGIENLPLSVSIPSDSHFNSRDTLASRTVLNETLYALCLKHGIRKCRFCQQEILTTLPGKDLEESLFSEFQDKLISINALFYYADDLAVTLDKLLRQGFYRIRTKGQVYLVDNAEELTNFKAKIEQEQIPFIEVTVDRLELKRSDQLRLSEALAEARRLSAYLGVHELSSTSEDSLLSRYFSSQGICSTCGAKAVPLERSLFDLTIGSKPTDYSQTSNDLKGLADLAANDQEDILSISWAGYRLKELLTKPVGALSFPKNLSDPDLDHLRKMLAFFNLASLGHLSLLRSVASLSHAEYLRLQLVLHLSRPLSGLLYLIDYPCLGLNIDECNKLTKLLKELCQRGNTILATEHQPLFLEAADSVTYFGPGSGPEGGQVVLGEITKAGELTTPEEPVSDRVIEIQGISKRNLKGFGFLAPLGALTCLTGPSGAGKHTLVFDVLHPLLKAQLASEDTLTPDELAARGVQTVSIPAEMAGVSVMPLILSPPTSYQFAAGYLGIFESFRNFYAKLELSRIRGYTPATFKIGGSKKKSSSGRCPECLGSGRSGLENMYSLADSDICPLCRGQRYEKEILDIVYKELSISDLLNLSLSEAAKLFNFLPRTKKVFELCDSLEIDYLKLGAALDGLSTGELRKLQMIRHLTNGRQKHVLHLLDQPGAALNKADCQLVAKALKKIVENGNTIVAVENNPFLLPAADHIVEL